MAFSLLISILCVIGLALWLVLRRSGASHLWSAGLLVVTAPLEVYRTSAGGFNLTVFRLALGVTVVVTVIDVVRTRRPVVVPSVFAVYALLLAWQAMSLIFVTPARSLGYRFASQYLAGLIAAFMITQTVRREDGRFLVRLYLAGSFIPLAAGAWRIFSIIGGGSGHLPGLSLLPIDPSIGAARLGGSYLLNGTLRMQATFSDPNHYGFYIATVLVVALAAACAAWISAVGRIPRATLTYGLMALAAAAAVLGTYSRSAWLLAFVAVLVGCLLAGQVIWTRRRAVVVSATAFAALAAMSPLLLRRLFGRAQGAVASDQVHASTARVALKLFEHHPILGTGLGDYGRHAGQPPLVSSAHSTFLTVAAELGAPGLALLLAAITFASVYAVRSAQRVMGAERLTQAGLAAAFIGLAVANAVYEVWMDDFQWVLFGTLLALTTQPGVRFAVGRGGAGSSRKAKTRCTVYGAAIE